MDTNMFDANKGITTESGSQDTSTMIADSSDFISLDRINTEGARKTETKYSPDWDKWHGIYRKIPEYQSAIDKLASWTFGRGIKADKKNKEKLKKIKGFGKEDANTVLRNQWRTALVCGDSYAYIATDKSGRLTNVKPLNPGSVNTVVSPWGIITRYEQAMIINRVRTVVEIFKPEEIYHLSCNRIADEIHGIPFGEKIEEMLKTMKEGLEDLRILYHRNIKPINWIEVNTDDENKLAGIKATVNKAYKETENIVVPMGQIGEIKRLSTPQYSTLDSLPWMKFLVRQFITSCGMPEIIMGWGSDTTEASSKIIYLAFQQTIEEMQLYNETQIEMQLGIELELEFPASIEEELQQDEKKDAGYQTKAKVGDAKTDTK